MYYVYGKLVSLAFYETLFNCHAMFLTDLKLVLANTHFFFLIIRKLKCSYVFKERGKIFR